MPLDSTVPTTTIRNTHSDSKEDNVEEQDKDCDEKQEKNKFDIRTSGFVKPLSNWVKPTTTQKTEQPLPQVVGIPDLKTPISNSELAEKPLEILTEQSKEEKVPASLSNSQPTLSAVDKTLPFPDDTPHLAVHELKSAVGSIPQTPPTTPSISAPAVRKAYQLGFLSPENSKLVFGCLDDSIVRNRRLITVCIHGDEICGMIAVNELIEAGFFDQVFSSPEYARDRVTIMVGNPKAVKANKRFIDVNLNRIFHGDKIHRNTHKPPVPTLHRRLSVDLANSVAQRAPNNLVYELSRIQPIAEEIEDCDEYIDIHSTSAKSYPFALPALDKESEEFARSFSVNFVIEKLVKSVSGTSIGWAHELKKKAICFECGQHEDREAIETAKKIVRRFVTGVMVDGGAKAVLSCEENEIVRKGFRFSRALKAFERVEFNQVIAKDDEIGDIKCKDPNGSYIIMPTANPIIGEEAWFWGELKYVRKEKEFETTSSASKFNLRQSHTEAPLPPMTDGKIQNMPPAGTPTLVVS